MEVVLICLLPFKVSIPHWIRLSYSDRLRISATDRLFGFNPTLDTTQLLSDRMLGVAAPKLAGFNPTLDTTQLLSMQTPQQPSTKHGFNPTLDTTQLLRMRLFWGKADSVKKFQSHIGYDSATQLAQPHVVVFFSAFQSHIGYDSATQASAT